MDNTERPDCEELFKKFDEVKRLNVELLEKQHQETVLDYPWSGNLGHWYMNIETKSVVFDQLKMTVLGYEESEIPDSVPYEFFTERIHSDDYASTMQEMRDHITGKKPVYECSYRIRTKDDGYKWFYDRGKITQWNDQGKPVLVAGIVFDISESKQREETLELENLTLRYEATTDALTGLLNRQAVMKALQTRMNFVRGQDQPLAVCMMDIDRFKQINDSKGHVYGDYVLQEVATVFTQEIRGLDVIGRYGGEEFIAIFYGADHQQSIRIAQRIRTHIEGLVLKDGVKVTISGGVASFKGQDITSFIDEADQLLYRAKEEGRNRIVG